MCLMFPHDQIQVMHSLLIYSMGDDVSSGYHLWSRMMFMHPLTGDVDFDHTVTVLSNSFTIQLQTKHTYTYIHKHLHSCTYVHTYVYFTNPKFIQICLISTHPQRFPSAFSHRFLSFSSNQVNTFTHILNPIAYLLQFWDYFIHTTIINLQTDFWICLQFSLPALPSMNGVYS